MWNCVNVLVINITCHDSGGELGSNALKLETVLLQFFLYILYIL